MEQKLTQQKHETDERPQNNGHELLTTDSSSQCVAGWNNRQHSVGKRLPSWLQQQVTTTTSIGAHHSLQTTWSETQQDTPPIYLYTTIDDVTILMTSQYIADVMNDIAGGHSARASSSLTRNVEVDRG